jgi:hypothetical protein
MESAANLIAGADLYELAALVDKVAQALAADRALESKSTIAAAIDDDRFEAVRESLTFAARIINGGDLGEAREVISALFNSLWTCSTEYEVGRDAFFRRVRGNGFIEQSYRDARTARNGQILAKIMEVA